MKKQEKRIMYYKENNMVTQYIPMDRCHKCGCCEGAIVYLPSSNGYGLYCSNCGVCFRFLNKSEKYAIWGSSKGRTAVSKTVNQSSSL